MAARFDGGLLQGLLSDLSYVAAIERLGRLLIKRVIWRVPSAARRIALTFDDGPHEVYTPQILDLLQKHQVRATFFVIGKHASARPALLRRIAEEGHEIGNHTFTHPLLPFRGHRFVFNELRQTHDLLGEMGIRPSFFRPPMGLFSSTVLNVASEMGYRTVVGDVYPRDPHQPGSRRISDRILDRARRGSIVILHDGGNAARVDRSQTIAAVDRTIPMLKQRGFEFFLLNELTNAGVDHG